MSTSRAGVLWARLDDAERRPECSDPKATWHRYGIRVIHRAAPDARSAGGRSNDRRHRFSSGKVGREIGEDEVGHGPARLDRRAPVVTMRSRSLGRRVSECWL